MNWTDTVMSDTDVKNFIGYWDSKHAEDIRLIKSEQAKITWPIAFKAGRDDGYRIGKIEGIATSNKYERQLGINEVVEWMEEQWSDWPNSAYLLQEYDLQAKKKEWGI